MGWPLRMFERNDVLFVTARCFQGRLLMRPSARTNEVLGGVLARAARLTRVEIFAFVFASNHFHLLIRAPEANLPQFMKYLRANVSKKVGWLVGWRGSFWERRYSAEPVLDDPALIGRVRYLLAHGVKEGLVRTCREWPGLSSLSQMLGGPRRTFRWFNWTRRWRARRTEGNDRFHERWSESETLELTPLPSCAARSEQARRKLIVGAVAAINRQGAASFPHVLGRSRVLAQDPQHRPQQPARRPRPWCHATFRELRIEFIERYRAFASLFLEASARWKRGDHDAPFPVTAVRPFLWPSRWLSDPQAAQLSYA